MREIRPSGSEGGGTGTTRPSLPLSLCRPFGPRTTTDLSCPAVRDHIFRGHSRKCLTTNKNLGLSADSADGVKGEIVFCQPGKEEQAR
jgi:hypothetical protein